MVLKYQFPFDLSHYDDHDGYNAPRAGSSPHRGSDFNGLAEGTGIPAIAAGTIIDSYRSPGLGNVVVIAHPDGMFSGYCHMNALSPIAVNTAVTRGQIIGGVGQTGTYADGVHLHLTVAFNANGATGGGQHWVDHTDPIPFIQARLNGDDPNTTTPQPKEDDMVRLVQIPISPVTVDEGVHWIVIDHGARAYWHVKSFPARDYLRAQGIIELAGVQPRRIIEGYRNITDLP